MYKSDLPIYFRFGYYRELGGKKNVVWNLLSIKAVDSLLGNK